MADTYTNLPGVVSDLQDFGLQLTSQVDLGDTIVLMGTAEKGPLNTPVAVQSPSKARETFGSYGAGTLVRGIFEAFGVSAAGKDIRGCRIGNATKATLGIKEASATGATASDYDDASYNADGTQVDAFTLTARKEGDEYNNASIRMDYISGRLAVVVYNPITGVESYYTYNSDTNVSADIHNVNELVTAVNADTNLNEDFVASMVDLNVEFEVDITNEAHVYATGVTITGDNVRINLKERLDTSVVGGDGTYPTGVAEVDELYGDNSSNFASVGNQILQVDEVYQIAVATGIALDCQNKDHVELDYLPMYRGSDKYIGNEAGSDFSSAEAVQRVVNGYIGVVESTGVLAYTWESVGDIRSATFTIYKTTGGVKTAIDSADYTLDSTATTVGVTFDHIGVVPDVGSILTVTYDTDAVSLTQAATKSAALATASWQTYFVSGRELYFGAAPPTDLVISYKYKKVYGVGGTVTLEDAKNGVFLFPATADSPKADIEAATFANPAIFGFKYSYQPEWIALNFNAQSLKGGSDGIVMSNYDKYEALTTAYEALEDYDADIFVPLGCYMDATKQSYNEETGALETFNAGFHTQLHNFLVDHSDGVGEALGIISVAPATSTTAAGVKSWVEKLTQVSTSDPLRAANEMATFDSKFVSVLAMEPVFSNNEATLPYASTGEAAYAGLIASVSPGISTTNQRLDNVIGTRYSLSRRQLDTLTGARYVTARRSQSNIGGIVVTDGVTGAASGSDYVRLTTVRAVFAAMKMIRQVAEPFIGTPADAIGKAALKTAINKGLNGMRERRDLRDYAFEITSTVQEMVQGILNVELIIVPPFEMRKIRVTVKLRPSL